MGGLAAHACLLPTLIPATVTVIEVMPHGAPHMDTVMPLIVYDVSSVSVYSYDTGDEDE